MVRRDDHTEESPHAGTEAHVFSDVSQGTVQQFAALLVERLAVAHIPEMAGMVRLYGRWTDPGRPSGKYYGAKVVDDGGAQVKVEFLCSWSTAEALRQASMSC